MNSFVTLVLLPFLLKPFLMFQFELVLQITQHAFPGYGDIKCHIIVHWIRNIDHAEFLKLQRSLTLTLSCSHIHWKCIKLIWWLKIKVVSCKQFRFRKGLAAWDALAAPVWNLSRNGTGFVNIKGSYDPLNLILSERRLSNNLDLPSVFFVIATT